MKVYIKKNPGRKTEIGFKIDRGTAATLGSFAGLAYAKLNRDKELKDAASKYILKSVDYNTKAEETKDPNKRAEYLRKSKEYEDKAKEISSLINKRNVIISTNDKEIKETFAPIIDKINSSFENGYITEEEKDELMSYTDINNYYLKEELEYKL